jgi:NADH dehydrogenase [ubiquinone] 1 alpha subcomplex assembly factor 5
VSCGVAQAPAVAALFDMNLRALRRDQAARSGPELFLFERAFEDCLERAQLIDRRFDRALLIGCPDAAWPHRMLQTVQHVDVLDPGALFARAAGGERVVEDEWQPPDEAYDLAFAIGTLDTVNDLPRALRSILAGLRPDGLLIGAISGGDTLPQLRSSMRAADQITGEASAHMHPRIEASALAPLLSAAGFAMPVVDVDRVRVTYRSFSQLIADLRGMAATNILVARSRRPVSRAAIDAARQSFASAGNGERTAETFEILHFAARKPAQG